MKKFKRKLIRVSDEKQKNYSYWLVEPTGKHFDLDFQPELTPKQMLSLGIFGGKYFEKVPKEFPRDWFKGAKLAKGKADKNLNFFKVEASQPLSVWKKKGWIYKEDPHGWFQWYCRYYFGRRIPMEDRRQINRWKNIKRHIAALMKNCEHCDLNCRRRQRQAVLHWAYDSRKI